MIKDKNEFFPTLTRKTVTFCLLSGVENKLFVNLKGLLLIVCLVRVIQVLKQSTKETTFDVTQF